MFSLYVARSLVFGCKIERCSFNILVPTNVNISKLTSIICNGFNAYSETRQFYKERIG